MNFSAYSIKNPLVAILLFSLLTLGGVLGFSKMKIKQFPDISIPQINISISYAGASPVQLETDIAKKVENKLTSLEGVKHIRSTLQTGSASIQVEFNLEKDLSEALEEVRSAVDEISGNLPAAAEKPVITKISTANFPVASYAISSDTMDSAELSWFIDDTLNKRLSGVNGLGSVSRIGGIERRIIVAANNTTLNSWNLPITALANQIASIQSDATGGLAKIGGGEQTIRILGAAKSIQELSNLPINTPKGASRLGEIASISDGFADLSSQALLNGRSVVAMNITASRTASEVTLIEDVDKALEKLSQELPYIKITKIYDNSEPVAEDYKASIQMLIEGCALAVIVVLLFLKDWRATLVAAAALPLSLIPTFLIMHLCGFSLNIISLLALSLVIGVLVDDAIVEVENIMRHLHMGKTPYEAAMEAADEIGLAVVATTFTLIAVFLPTAFMDGVIGQFFRQFGWTAAISVFISLMVARLVTPMMAAYILKAKPPKDEKTGKIMNGYLSIVQWTLNHRLVTVILAVSLFIGSLSLAKMLSGEFVPPDDANQTQVSLELTPDAILDDTVRIAQMTADKIAQIPGVDSVFIAAGRASTGGDEGLAGATNTATLNISLKPRKQRVSKLEIEHQISQAIKSVPSARFTVGQSATGDSGYGFSLVSDNSLLLERTTEDVLKAIRELPIVTSVTSSKPLPKPELAILPNALNMADKGVTTLDLANTLRIATSGDYTQALPKLNLDTRQIPIVVRLSDDVRQSEGALKNLYIPSNISSLGSVKVSEVADIKFSTGAAQIDRLDRNRTVKITVQSAAELGEVVKQVKELNILQNLPNGITLIDEGQASEMAELFTGFAIAMAVGVFCIFGVLILLFHKILQPFTILIALPLSVGGALFGLVISGSTLSISSLIGFIMLMGIATKNSILLVDYAIIAEKNGMDRVSALLDACQKRARPIIMTSIAMGAGMLPLVLGMGDVDDSFRKPMAIAVIGGLITSTALSLVVIPVIYTLMEDFSRIFKRKPSHQPV